MARLSLFIYSVHRYLFHSILPTSNERLADQEDTRYG